MIAEKVAGGHIDKGRLLWVCVFVGEKHLGLHAHLPSSQGA